MNARKKLRTNSIARSMRELALSLKSASSSPFDSLVNNIENYKINCVVDVGANVGQFGLDIRRHGYKGELVSFEPVAETFDALLRTIKNRQPWKAIQLGLGSRESELTMNVSRNDGLSSSLLDIKNLHISNFPESEVISSQKVKISSLDIQLNKLAIDPRSILLKIDVQGYEAEVLKGASESLTKIPLCYLEVSLQPLYEGEITLLPILNLLSISGHEVIDVYRGVQASDGNLLQLDILTKLSSK
jgi:FkbM family methyltransferase